MKNLSVKQAAEKIIELAKEHGYNYWCKEIEEFNATLDYITMTKANEKARSIIKYGR